MRWTVSEWNECPEETIKNCFLHCFKREPVSAVEVDESGGADEIRAEMERNATEHGVTFTRAGIDALLNPEEEDDVVESFSFEELVRSAAGVEDVIIEEPDQDTSLEAEGLYTVDEELKGVAVTNAALSRLGLLTADLGSKLRGCQRELRAQKIAELKQTTITDHFTTSNE